jgi:hypothetical protein
MQSQDQAHPISEYWERLTDGALQISEEPERVHALIKRKAITRGLCQRSVGE